MAMLLPTRDHGNAASVRVPVPTACGRARPVRSSHLTAARTAVKLAPTVHNTTRTVLDYRYCTVSLLFSTLMIIRKLQFPSVVGSLPSSSLSDAEIISRSLQCPISLGRGPFTPVPEIPRIRKFLAAKRRRCGPGRGVKVRL